jgi:hypothetical protein
MYLWVIIECAKENIIYRLVGNWNNKVGLCWFDWIHEHTHIYTYIMYYIHPITRES